MLGFLNLPIKVEYALTKFRETLVHYNTSYRKLGKLSCKRV